MVERVARAIFDASMISAGRTVLWDDDWPAEHTRNEARQCARAAIEAMKEPNTAMIDAGDLSVDFDPDSGSSECNTKNIWQAMISAALADKEPG
jgi:hypothetical protein